MYISELDPDQLDHDTINKLIYENLEDDKLPGDLIFVFGSVTAPKYRVPKAVELYKNNRSSKVLMSGGQSAIPEATLMKEVAVNQGVKESDIITEIKSQNTKENIIYSKHLLDQEIGLENIKRIIIVTNLFHLRRCLLSMQTYMPEWIEYSLCGVLDTNTRPDNWYLNEKGRTRVKQEVERLIKYTRSKEIIDSLF
ncbi:YdcF family protein [Paenibacillus sp. TRM 82003]|nr:YdcF family protein [Paenibacillus sp. TRM 82003]